MTNEYERSGVNIQAGYQVRDSIKKQLQDQKEMNIGNFGGIFDLDVTQLNNPILVSGTDGVGTKLLISKMSDNYSTIGIDCVAMCVNDIITLGAKPLYFMDYIASGKTKPQKIKQIVEGVISGCKEENIKLIGGETAEMPGLYEDQHFDLAGFSVGIVDKSELLSKKNVEVGDVVLGIKSNGIHSNGFSLVRKIFFEDNDYQSDTELLQELLKPTRIYVNEIMPQLNKKRLKALAHITGGGFYENIPRILPDDLAVRINCNNWPELDVFSKIRSVGRLNKMEMFNIFNMGIGMVMITSKENSKKILNEITDVYSIGEVIVKENDSVELVD